MGQPVEGFARGDKKEKRKPDTGDFMCEIRSNKEQSKENQVGYNLKQSEHRFIMGRLNLRN